MDISIAVEGCQKLSLAPCAQDPYSLFMIAFLVSKSIMKNIRFRFRHACINLIAAIPERAHQPNQKLLKVNNRLRPLIIHLNHFIHIFQGLCFVFKYTHVLWKIIQVYTRLVKNYWKLFYFFKTKINYHVKFQFSWYNSFEVSITYKII